MKGSEFNHNEIKNARGGEAHEYGFIPRKEYARQKEEIGKTPHNEVNSSDSHENNAQKTTVKSNNPVSHAVNASSSATKASAISNGVHATIVAATVVSTALIGAAIGIKTVTETRAEATFSSFVVEEDSLFYLLNVRSSKEDAVFDMRVYNYSYDSSNEILVGENEGRFEGLTPDETYTVEIAERGFFSNVIYKETFSCKRHEVPYAPTFYGIVFDHSLNLFAEEIEIRLDYVDDDEEFEAFEFELTQLGGEPLSAVYELEKTTETQTIYLQKAEIDFDYLYADFRYDLTVYENGQKKLLASEQFRFSDNSGLNILINDPRIEYRVNVEEGTFPVALDFKDPYEFASSFLLYIDTPAGDSVVFPLEKTTEWQLVHLREAIDFNPLYLTDGVGLRFAYIDIDGVETTFYSLEGALFEIEERLFIEATLLHEANFADKEIYVELSYEDPKEELDTVLLRLEDVSGNEYEFMLEKTLDRQSLSFARAGYPNVELNATDAWSYSFVYTVLGKEGEIAISSGSLAFSDPTLPPIQSFFFPKTADFSANSFDIEVYWNGNPLLESASLTLSSEEDPARSQVFEVPLVSGTHTLYADVDPTQANAGLDLSSGESFAYSFKYVYDGNETTYEEGSVIFTNSNPSHFDSLSFDYALSQNKNFIFFHADYHDPERIYSSLQIDLDDGSGTTYTWYNELLPHGFLDLTYDTNANEVPIIELLGKQVTFRASTIAYIDSEEVVEPVFEEEVLLSRNSISKTFGLQLVSREFNKQHPSIAVIPFILDDAGTLHDFQLVVSLYDGSKYHFPIPLTADMSYPPSSVAIELADCDDEGFDLESFVAAFDQEVSLSLSYFDQQEEFEFPYLESIRFDIID